VDRTAARRLAILAAGLITLAWTAADIPSLLKIRPLPAKRAFTMPPSVWRGKIPEIPVPEPLPFPSQAPLEPPATR